MDKQQVLTKMTDAGLVAVVRASNAEDAIRRRMPGGRLPFNRINIYCSGCR